MKTIKVSEIIKELEKGEYSYYGLRVATEHDVEIMDRGYLDPSYDWIDGEITENELSGTCAIGITEDCDLLARIELTKKYVGAQLLLIADNNCEYGNDEDEIILGRDGFGADVIAIVVED